MLVNADLHIHSRFSSATSNQMTLARLAKEASKKGIQLLATGDCLHPLWQQEIRKTATENHGIWWLDGTAFVLTAEVEDRNRVHHLLLFPSLEAAQEYHTTMKPYSTTLSTDGRPKVRRTGRAIVELVHDVEGLIGPAHAFTPWTALYAAHNSLDECYEGTPVDFLELGLSADSSYADQITELHELTFLSNSDSHSPNPIRLAREFNRLEIPSITWDNVHQALLRRNGRRVTMNVGFPPEEGKYNRTACTSCYRQYTEAMARDNKWRCGCGGLIKKGVRDRVAELADVPTGHHPPHRPPYRHLIPLAEIIAKALQMGSTCKTVERQWENLMVEFGSEITVLLDIPRTKLVTVASSVVAEAVAAFRDGNIIVHPGGGGKYGEIEILANRSTIPIEKNAQRRLFEWAK
jgi:uncharacterized protein (TIGR00375 family)